MVSITDDMLKLIVRADFENGELYWLPRDRSLFYDDRSCNTWNTRYAGKPAMTHIDIHGYRTGKILDRLFSHHRLMWFMAFGEWPDEIDHINRNTLDNRIVNLRSVTKTENQRNKSRSKNCTSGVMGVTFYKRTGRWRAHITIKSRHVHIGYFDTFDQAVSARLMAQKEHGFHPTHGVNNA